MTAQRRLSRHNPWTIVVLVVLGTALLCPGLWFVGLPAFCSHEFRLPPPRVDSSLLQHLTWPGDRDSIADVLSLQALDEFAEVAGSHWVKGSKLIRDDCRYADLAVEAYLAPPMVDAKARFHDECKQKWPGADTSDYQFGGKDESEFCVSYRQPIRADAYGLCLPATYESFSVFRKDNLIITIDERASSTTSFMGVLLEQLVGSDPQ